MSTALSTTTPNRHPRLPTRHCHIVGCYKKNCRGVGVCKIYSHPSYNNKLSTIFANTNQDPNHTCFIQFNIFSSLSLSNKVQYVDYQYQYAKKYRSLLIEGFLNYVISTTVYDLDSVPLTILELLVIVPDYHQSHLLTQAQGMSNTTIELKTVNLILQ
jgi:hypothetical protein